MVILIVQCRCGPLYCVVVVWVFKGVSTVLWLQTVAMHSLVGSVVVIGLDTYKLSVTYNTLLAAGPLLKHTSSVHTLLLTLNITIYMRHRNTYEE